MTNNKLFNENRFYWILPAILLLTFLIHTQLFPISYTENKLASAYVVNAFLAIAIYVVINIIIKKSPKLPDLCLWEEAELSLSFFS